MVRFRLTNLVKKACAPSALLFFLTTGFLVAHESAVQAQIPFQSGAIIGGESCEIIVNSPGTLATNPGETILSSRETGGTGGVATVTSRKLTGNPPGLGPSFRVSFEAPTAFTTMPVGGDLGVTFETRFSGVNISRGRNFNNRRGDRPVRLRRRGISITQITGDLIATRTGSPFPAGTYSAVGVLRCE